MSTSGATSMIQSTTRPARNVASEQRQADHRDPGADPHEQVAELAQQRRDQRADPLEERLCPFGELRDDHVDAGTNEPFSEPCDELTELGDERRDERDDPVNERFCPFAEFFDNYR
jgi:hypothetical protein